MLVKIIKYLYNFSNINIGNNNFNNFIRTQNTENIKSCTRSNCNFAYCLFWNHFYLLLVSIWFQNMKGYANYSGYKLKGSVF